MLKRLFLVLTMFALPCLSVTIDDFPRTPPEVHARLYEQVDLIHRVCQKHNIKYWLIGGSLLGQVRGEFLYGLGAIIPWDDDADVGIDIADRGRLVKALAGEAHKFDMAVVNSAHGAKLRCLRSSGIGTDIFVYKKVDSYDHPSLKTQAAQSVWILGTEASRKAWPNDFFLTHELDKLSMVKFGPIEVMIPSPALRYLKTGYGNDCMQVGRIGFNHGQNKPHANAGATAPLGNSSADPQSEL